ncbi:MAG TPA: hypothetical protein VLW53_11185 [Candidatus Eisenbacteria bacterium]|nr:hypothetical protein [Candidatus Eisenbacteria bacterium]
MVTWRALLLVYRSIDLPGDFRHTLGDEEVAAGLDSFSRFPELAAELSGGEVEVVVEVAHVRRALGSLTPMGDGMRWPSPDDTRPELTRLAPPGARDSLFALWPQRDLATGAHVPTGGWGLAIRGTEWSNGATYATVANADAAAWARPVVGEVWLHEWLHGVCDHFARRGYEMPPRDADGGDAAGYVQSPTDGWCAYYRDLMTARVSVGGRLLGIAPAAWRTGSILSSPRT